MHVYTVHMNDLFTVVFCCCTIGGAVLLTNNGNNDYTWIVPSREMNLYCAYIKFNIIGIRFVINIFYIIYLNRVQLEISSTLSAR